MFIFVDCSLRSVNTRHRGSGGDGMVVSYSSSSIHVVLLYHVLGP